MNDDTSGDEEGSSLLCEKKVGKALVHEYYTEIVVCKENVFLQKETQ